jgi:hypothetical protein
MSGAERKGWQQQVAVRAALEELVGGMVALVIDDVRACQAALEAAEPAMRQRAIGRWGVEDAWRAFAPDSLIRVERVLSGLAIETSPAATREG